MVRKSDICIGIIGLLFLALILLLTVHPVLQKGHHHRIEVQKRLVAVLGLTDLSLFTEARYTRHISQADSHAAFQDHPRAIEHFPSGSIVVPPSSLWANRGTTHALSRNAGADRKFAEIRPGVAPLPRELNGSAAGGPHP